MSKTMMILGIVFAAIGIALGILIYLAAGQMLVYGLTPEVAAVSIIGGFVILGLGAAISSLDRQARAIQEFAAELPSRGQNLAPPEEVERSTRRVWPAESSTEIAAAAIPGTETAETPLFAGTAARAMEDVRERAEGRSVERTATDSTVVETRSSTGETLAAIEQAKTDIDRALAPLPPETEAGSAERPPQETEAEPAGEPEDDEEQLYVIEEKLIRARPARVLSDGTVEAETDEGWMRFENLEHLEEYLDAMAPPKA